MNGEELAMLEDFGALDWCAAELEFQAVLHEQACRMEPDAGLRESLAAQARKCRAGAEALRKISAMPNAE